MKINLMLGGFLMFIEVKVIFKSSVLLNEYLQLNSK
jgi:hypothetical protein